MYFRQIRTSLWREPEVKALQPDHKLLYFYLRTNEHTHLSGIYWLPLLYMSNEVGLDENVLRDGLQALQNGNLAYYDAAQEIVWVVDMYGEASSSPKIKKNVEQHLKGLKRSLLLCRFVDHYKIDTVSIGYQYPIDTVSSRIGEERGGKGEESLKKGWGGNGNSEQNKDKEGDRARLLKDQLEQILDNEKRKQALNGG